MLRTKHPGLALVYLTDLDTVQHEHGPLSPEAWAKLETIDGLIGELVTTAKAQSPHATIAIVSDHGFVPVDTDIRANVALRAEGLLEANTQTKDGRTEDVLTHCDAITWKSGGTVAIMGLHGREEPTASKVKALFARLAAEPKNRIAKVHDGAEIERAGGFPGAIVVLEAAPGATFSGRLDGPLTAPSHYRDLGTVDMLDIAPTLASLLGIALPTAEGKPLSAALQRRSR